MSKLLKILFVILLVVTVAEAGYYVYVIRINQYSDSKKIDIDEAAQNTPVPSLIVRPSPSGSANPLIKSSSIDFLKTEFIPYLSSIANNPAKSVSVLETYNGYVDLIKLDDPTHLLHIKVVDEKGENLISYTIPEQFIEVKRFYRVKNGVKTKIHYSDIKPGDKMTVISYTDLVHSDGNYIEFDIGE